MLDVASRFGAEVADSYDGFHKHGWRWQFEHQTLRALLERLPDLQTVLDLPCGTGRLLETFEAHRLKSFGVDKSVSMLEHAMAKGMATGRGDIFEPLSMGKFDLVVCFGFLNWCDYAHMLATFETLAKHADPYICFTVDTRYSFTQSKSRNRWFPALEDLEAIFNALHFGVEFRVSRIVDRDTLANIVLLKAL